MVSISRKFLNNSVYHIFNRGSDKRDIFTENADYNRFLKSLIYYQQKGSKVSLSKFLELDIDFSLATTHEKQFEVIAFCLMPNHFHLMLQQIEENGISVGIANITNSYTRYFNIKHDRSGHLFQGAFKSVNVLTDEQYIHLARYIMINPYTSFLTNDITSYPWSSYMEYFRKNIHIQICDQSHLLSQFDNNPDNLKLFIDDYKDFARTREEMKNLYTE